MRVEIFSAATAFMLDLAKHIVETKAGHFEPAKFEDHYEAALQELLEKTWVKVGHQKECTAHSSAWLLLNLTHDSAQGH